MVRLLYREISDLNSNNRTKDVHNLYRNWTDILNVNDNDRYEMTLKVFNNEGLSAETMKYIFFVRRGNVRYES